VRHWAGQRRKREPHPNNVSAAKTAAYQVPSARQITRLLMSDDARPEAAKRSVSRWLTDLPGLADCIAAAKRLNKVLRRISKESLDTALQAAAGTTLKDFVVNLQGD
jgi:hypothetical protein